MGNSLAVQWLGLHALNVEGLGSIPGQGTKIPQAVWHGQKKKKPPLTNKNETKQKTTTRCNNVFQSLGFSQLVHTYPWFFFSSQMRATSNFYQLALYTISRINLTSSHHLIHSSYFKPLSFPVWINKTASLSMWWRSPLVVPKEASMLIFKCLSVPIIPLFKSKGFQCFE